MHDIYDSPAWSSLHPFLQSPYHLVFALYIDWLNPLTNKIAGMSINFGVWVKINKCLGKVVSCGAIILYCLNLPISIRFLHANTLTVGMTPSPHVLEPIKKMILDLDLPGKVLPTYHNPQGTAVAVRLIPLLADLQAICKVSGFVSHAAGLFCSFCKCHHDDIENLDYQNWELRRGTEVHTQAQEWHNLTTIKAKIASTKKTGVWQTPLHDLPYWDPVQYVILGFMHNFLEGILQYHLRVRANKGCNQIVGKPST
jgi:hypothetical protein